MLRLVVVMSLLQRLRVVFGEELESTFGGLAITRPLRDFPDHDSEAAQSDRFIIEVLEKVEASSTPLETVQALRKQIKPTWLKDWDEQNKAINVDASAHTGTTSAEKSS